MKINLKKNLASLILALLLIPSVVLNIYQFFKNKTSDQGILVIEVLDGDTILLDGDVRLRLRHIDAPELEFCGGKEAKDLLTKLVRNKKIIIQEQILDQYGRPMALVYQNDKLINEKMLKSGWVRFHHDKSSASENLKKIAGQVKETKTGIFSSRCYQTENPDNPGCLIKANIDKNSTRRNYYFPGCAQYEFTIVEKDLGETWFCSEEEAQAAGFTKSKTCHDKKYQ